LLGALVSGCDDPAPNFDFDGDGWDDEQDCDPADALTYPGADDGWGDGVDQNCDGTDGSDHDGDGYPNDAPELSGEWDCDDLDDRVHPHAVEVCNGVDDDCDGSLLWEERDADDDGFLECGDGAIDCDDANAASHPGAAEVCDGQDNDCDGAIGEDEVDQDADGYMSCEGDCDDADPALTAADEDGDGYSTCDGDCDDDDTEVSGADDDGDGFSTCEGDCDDADGSLTPVDEDGDGFSTCAGDCSDSDPDTHPEAAEICGDGADNDCDGGQDADDADCATPPAFFTTAISFHADGGGSGGTATLELDFQMLDWTLAMTCSESFDVAASYDYGSGVRMDYFEYADAVLTWASYTWTPGSCPVGWEFFRTDPLPEWLWTGHPLTFVSCDVIDQTPTLAATFLGDDPSGIGAGTFGDFCQTTGPSLAVTLGHSAVEGIWLVAGFEGQIDIMGTYAYFSPPETANVEVWMLGGLLFAAAGNTDEPTTGLSGDYELHSFWAIPNICMNHVDDDGDGWRDLDDTGCRNIFQTDESRGDDTACSNGLDDDGDGLIDSLDPGCHDGWDDDET
jgi:hypothetical protein